MLQKTAAAAAAAKGRIGSIHRFCDVAIFDDKRRCISGGGKRVQDNTKLQQADQRANSSSTTPYSQHSS